MFGCLLFSLRWDAWDSWSAKRTKSHCSPPIGRNRWRAYCYNIVLLHTTSSIASIYFTQCSVCQLITVVLCYSTASFWSLRGIWIPIYPSTSTSRWCGTYIFRLRQWGWRLSYVYHLPSKSCTSTGDQWPTYISMSGALHLTQTPILTIIVRAII